MESSTSGIFDLVWSGTSGQDNVLFEEVGGYTYRVTETTLNGSSGNVVQTISGVNGRVIAYGKAGNDQLDARSLTHTQATLDGGAGNNTLYGGQAGDILIGGSNGGEGKQGSNTIIAGNGPNTIYGNAATGAEGSTGGSNLIVGGVDNDTIYGAYQTVRKKNGAVYNGAISTGGEGGQNLIVGGGGQHAIYASQQADGGEGGKGSILCAGTTTLNQAALASVLGEWTSTRDYETRIANIAGTATGTRNNGNNFLTAGSTVFKDPSVDQLFGDTKGASNWLWYPFAAETPNRVKAGDTQTDTPSVNSQAPSSFGITGPAANLDNDDILVTWQPSTGADHYRIVLSKSPDLSSPIFTQVATTGTSQAVNDVGAGTTYIGVFAINAFGIAAASNNPYQVVITPPDIRQTLFVTDWNYYVNDINEIPAPVQYFGSAEAADYQCTRAASDAGLLSDPWDYQTIHYKAILSAEGASIAERAQLNDGGFKNVAGQEIAPDLASLLSGNFEDPILTQTGQLIVGQPVWTGANPDGTASHLTAQDWSDPFFSSAIVGIANGSGTSWLSDHTIGGEYGAHLYCVSID